MIGLLLVWLYAAMRPRFGPGPKTAILAALVVWICGFVFHIDWVLIGMMSMTTNLLATLAALVQVIPAALVGAMLYKEDAPS